MLTQDLFLIRRVVKFFERNQRRVIYLRTQGVLDLISSTCLEKGYKELWFTC
jgi:hypothetical protein